jgi:hypothetical protein
MKHIKQIAQAHVKIDVAPEGAPPVQFGKCCEEIFLHFPGKQERNNLAIA